MNRTTKTVSLLIVGIVISFIIYLSRQRKDETIVVQHPLGGQFAGDQQCISCHSQTHQEFMATAHMNSTSEASLKTVRGSFD